ncbi:predicted protein [Lichtheimia corymbifera JMRC:FSU:9682]|uniref:Uncharacterized protein n=1 Tax=Lichtheimia corymbifera JMRC:FSU:9682 TaxID=1263082 RepID=A0A068RNK0_9FUNG|nr:predicted protein [Lichtheimia corymbifera JMRC:FSU:9682]
MDALSCYKVGRHTTPIARGANRRIWIGICKIAHACGFAQGDLLGQPYQQLQQRLAMQRADGIVTCHSCAEYFKDPIFYPIKDPVLAVKMA